MCKQGSSCGKEKFQPEEDDSLHGSEINFMQQINNMRK